MTQAYVNGFFTKCAQAGVPYDLAVRMIKAADNPMPPGGGVLVTGRTNDGTPIGINGRPLLKNPNGPGWVNDDGPARPATTPASPPAAQAAKPATSSAPDQPASASVGRILSAIPPNILKGLNRPGIDERVPRTTTVPAPASATATAPARASIQPNPITGGAISPALLKFLNRRPGITEPVNPAHRGWR